MASTPIFNDEGFVNDWAQAEDLFLANASVVDDGSSKAIVGTIGSGGSYVMSLTCEPAEDDLCTTPFGTEEADYLDFAVSAEDPTALAVSLSGGDYVTQQVPFTFLSELDPVVALLDGANASMLRLTLSQLTAIDIPNEVISPIPADEIPWTSISITSWAEAAQDFALADIRVTGGLPPPPSPSPLASLVPPPAGLTPPQSFPPTVTPLPPAPFPPSGEIDEPPPPSNLPPSLPSLPPPDETPLPLPVPELKVPQPVPLPGFLDDLLSPPPIGGDSDDDDGISVGAVTGIVVGSVMLFVLIALAIFWVVGRNRKTLPRTVSQKRTKVQSAGASSHPPTPVRVAPV
mmetsp:Transcript_3819/g.13607  ORF Transcript_3819/g.13607 Transcript_3819/m.13607 type:complete len:345 (-) Transcript_3819:34-1068(-)